MPTYTFTEEQAEKANQEWGCNCGPTALAFALQSTLDHARYLLPGFDAKRYTNPTMMRHAIAEAGRTISPVLPPAEGFGDYSRFFHRQVSLVRIQWAGPWTEPNANPKWRYRFTHWITTWSERDVPILFDCNGGIQGPDGWEAEIVRAILQTIPNANGKWWATDIWRLNPQKIQ